MKDTGGALTVASAATVDGQLLISVRDLGIGLPVDQTESAHAGPGATLQFRLPSEATALFAISSFD
jgi:hypothetical protein